MKAAQTSLSRTTLFLLNLFIIFPGLVLIYRLFIWGYTVLPVLESIGADKGLRFSGALIDFKNWRNLIYLIYLVYLILIVIFNLIKRNFKLKEKFIVVNSTVPAVIIAIILCTFSYWIAVILLEGLIRLF